MSGRELTVFAFGVSPVSVERSADVEWRTIAGESPYDVDAERLNDLVSEAEGEFVTFVIAPVRLAELKAAIRTLREADDAVGVLLAARTGRLFDAWARYPSRLASLAVPLASESLVVRPGLPGNGCPFLGVEQPLWDFVIRASAAGHRIAILPTAADRDAESVVADPVRLLAPGVPAPSAQWLAEHLEAFDPASCSCPIVSRPDAVAVKAGLWQIHGFLDESHSLAQGIEGEGRHRSGDHWHAIMHRREPDESNSRYWYRRVGLSPVFEEFGRRAAGILGECGAAGHWAERLLAGGWDPFAFVDFCAEARRRSDLAMARCAARIQQIEMDLLLRQSFADAVGKAAG